jgi:hypothetical protein
MTQHPGNPRTTARSIALALATTLLFLAGTAAAQPAPDPAAEPAGAPPHLLGFDIAMDASTFSFEGPTNDAGFPADGTPFIVRGHLYPAGTFDAHGSASGTLPDGSPEFPDQVLGTWYCRGWHLQDGDALTGPVVATTQIFDLDLSQPGSRTIVTEGIELADFGVPFLRSVTGGTGRFRNLRGQTSQIYHDFNASGGFNTSVVLPTGARPD